MPKKLPEDLFAGDIARRTQTYLEGFRDGELSREEVQAHVRESVDTAMNTIAGNRGAAPDAERLDKK